MTVHLYTSPATESVSPRLFVVTDQQGEPPALYEFLVDEDDGERITFVTARSLGEGGEVSETGLTDKVRQAVTDAGYTLSGDEPTRRDVLERSIGIGAAALAGTTATVSGDRDDGEQSRGPIPAPFDSLPTIDDPDDKQREHADVFFPPRAIPEKGPIPDYHHTHTVERDLTVPNWALETARYRLGFSDPEDVDRWLVEDVLMESAHIWERFVTPGGRDAAEVLLEEVRNEGGTDGRQ